MSFQGKELKDIVVTLPLMDGTEVECGVAQVFEVDNKTYFALLPLKGKELDRSQSYMLYRVEEDDQQNPIVLYIEDDMEYNAAANYFSAHYLNRPLS